MFRSIYSYVLGAVGLGHLLSSTSVAAIIAPVVATIEKLDQHVVAKTKELSEHAEQEAKLIIAKAEANDEIAKATGIIGNLRTLIAA